MPSQGDNLDCLTLFNFMSTEQSSTPSGTCPFGHGQQAPVTNADQCPVIHAAGGGTTNQDWWPNQLKVDILHQHDARSNPMEDDFDYRKSLSPSITMPLSKTSMI